MAIPNQSGTETGSLAERLRARIRAAGPISFHDWMQAALYDAAEGYYCRSDRVRWGRKGDYRTAPETSSLFAATFARYFARLFEDLDSPSQLTIIEGGAGAGEFARGVLTSLQAHYPRVFAATQYLVDEVSADACEQTRDKLSRFDDRVEFGRLGEIERPVTGIVFSNELLDAFPIHRVTMREGKPRELCVALGEAGDFVWTESELTPQLAEYLQRSGVQLADGQIMEVNLAAEDWIARASAVLTRGFVISVDYGSERDELLSAPHRRQGTLRAFHSHQIGDNPLAIPGEKDLTTTVDWTRIREAGTQGGLETVRFERLDQFLLNVGLLEELERVSAEQSELETLRLRTSAREMIMPHGMAASFQVLVQRK